MALLWIMKVRLIKAQDVALIQQVGQERCSTESGPPYQEQRYYLHPLSLKKERYLSSMGTVSHSCMKYSLGV